MNFLGEKSTGGISTEQEQKLDAITVEPGGEVKFDNGIIVNGGASEIKTVQTVIEDDILQINRVSTNDIAGITIKNSSDGLHANLLNEAGTWKFMSGASTENNTTQLASIRCGAVNGVNVADLQIGFTAHVDNADIHTPLDDVSIGTNSLWSSSKINTELTNNAQASTDDLNDFKTNEFANLESNALNHINNLDKHREINDNFTGLASLWSSNKINTVTSDINTALNLHIADAVIHSELDDNQTTTQTLWSSNKINTELTNNAQASTTQLNNFVNNTYTTFETTTNNHINNLDKHREINDNLTSLTSLWSSNKTSDYIEEKTASKGLSELTDGPEYTDADAKNPTYEAPSTGFVVAGNVTYQGGQIDDRINGGNIFYNSFVKRTDFSVSPPAIQTLITDELPGQAAFSTDDAFQLKIAGKYLIAAMGYKAETGSNPVIINPRLDGSGIFFYDISDPTQGMVYQQSMLISGYGIVKGFSVSGRYIYVNYNDGVIRTFDILQPSPILVSTLLNTAVAAESGVHSNANYLFILTTNTLFSYDISTDPSTPILVGSFVTNGNPSQKCSVLDKNLILIGWNGLIIKLDLSTGVTTPTKTISPSITGSVVRGIAVCGKYAITTTQVPLTLGVTDITSLTPLQGIPLQYFLRGVGIGDKVYLSGNLYDTGVYGSVIKTFTFDRFTSTSIGCCDIVSDKNTTELLVATNASIYGGLTVGNTFSARDTLIDGNLKVDGKIECNDIEITTADITNLTVDDVNVSNTITTTNINTDVLNATNNNSTNLTSTNLTSTNINSTNLTSTNINTDVLTANDINSTNIVLSGNLTVNGTTTTLNTENITAEDPLIKIANNNPGNSLNAGIYLPYRFTLNQVNQLRYSGIVRNHSDGVFHLLNNESIEPNINDPLSTVNLGEFRLDGLRANFITANDPLGNLYIAGPSTLVTLSSLGLFSVNSNLIILKNVEQDVEKSAFGQYHITYVFPNFFTTTLNNTYLSALPIQQANQITNNVAYNNALNTFTIQISGWYKFNYTISLKNKDDDDTVIIVILRKNGIAGDEFANSSISLHNRMKNRKVSHSASFIHEMVVGDTIRMSIGSFNQNGQGNQEDIEIYNVSVNLERLRLNI